MNNAAAFLKQRSYRHLLDLRYQIEENLTQPNVELGARTRSLELGRAMFEQINWLLKEALDADDLETFTEVEREWAAMLDDVDLVDVQTDPDSPSAALRELLRYRDVLRLGLVMWAVHLLATRDGEREQEGPVTVARILSQHFPTIEGLFDAFDRATDREEHDKVPWTSWFLEELPSGEAHFIPTRQELLFATILLCTGLIGNQAPALQPREWLKWRYDEISAALDRLEGDPERWARFLVLPTVDKGLEPPAKAPHREWLDRLAALREVFAQAQEETEASELAAVREAPLDPDRVAQFRRDTLEKSRQSRLIRAVFHHQGGLEGRSGPPAGHVAQVSRTWIPKTFFTPDSRVVGLDMAAGDLARVTANSEINQLLNALPDKEPVAGEGEFDDTVRGVLEELRRARRRPSLIVIPVGWELRQALGIRRWGGAPVEAHPLIPLMRRRDFEGVFEDVPVIDFPHVSKDKLWVIDLAAAARYVEWPSDEDSGLRFELTSFDAQSAATFLTEHPEVRGEGRNDDEAIHDLQERMLLTLQLCWKVLAGEAEAAVPIAVPPELQRDQP